MHVCISSIITFDLCRWYVRLFDGSDRPKEGWIPANILDLQRTKATDVIFSGSLEDADFRRQ